MTLLCDLATLRIVARRPSISGDTATTDGAFAAWVLENASALVCDTAGRPDWETTAVPPRTAKRIAQQVATRTYLNFEQVIQSSVGPLSERVREEAAMALELTDSEIAALGALPTDAPKGGGFWVQPMSNDDIVDDSIYLYDADHGHDGDAVLYADSVDSYAFDPEAS